MSRTRAGPSGSRRSVWRGRAATADWCCGTPVICLEARRSVGDCGSARQEFQVEVSVGMLLDPPHDIGHGAVAMEIALGRRLLLRSSSCNTRTAGPKLSSAKACPPGLRPLRRTSEGGGRLIIRQASHKEAAGSARSRVARHSVEALRCVSEQDAGPPAPLNCHAHRESCVIVSWSVARGRGARY